MKILHTADWHLGHILYEHDRTPDFSQAMEQLVQCATRERPDAIIISGDIFDRSAPSIQAKQLFTSTLLQLRATLPHATIVAIAGNHDGKSGLNLEGKLWHELNVTVIGHIEKEPSGAIVWHRHIIEVKDEQGTAVGYVVAVPHIYESGYPQQQDADMPNERRRAFFATLSEKVKAVNVSNLPVVLSAHMTLAGSELSETMRRQATIGNLDAVDVEELGSIYDYVAMGHIHKPQTVHAASPMIRYCGSLVPVSFDEDYPHGVSVVELGGQCAPLHKFVEFQPDRRLHTLSSTPLDFTSAISALNMLPRDFNAYIRLYLKADTKLPADYNEMIAQALEGKKALYCCIKMAQADEDSTATDAPETFRADNMPEPIELAKLIWLHSYGEPMPQSLITKMNGLLTAPVGE